MRGDERREQLIQAAMGLFAKKGFSGTTTKEIAAAAGVTEALIFRHFPTKDALYEAILLWRMENSRFAHYETAIRAIAERRDDEALLRAVARGMLDFHRENVDFLRLMFFAGLENHSLAERFRSRHIKPFCDFLAEYIASRQRDGAFCDVDPAAAVQLIIGMPFHYSIQKNLFNCNLLAVEDEQAVETFVRIALDGLRHKRESDHKEDRS
jgi:TetR/AcrR family transcriptional regulator